MTTASPAGSTRSAVAPRRLHATIVLSLVLSLVGSIYVATPRSAEAAAAWTTTALNLRTGPSTGDAVILVMPAGAPVNIVRNVTNGYYKVHYNGTAGWAYAAYLTRSNPGGGSAPPPTSGGGNNGATGNATVNVGGLNLRSGPGTNNPVILVMPYGASVTLTGETSNGFAALTYNGRSGWAASQYLSGGGSSAPPPSGNDGGPTAGPTGSATVNTNGLNLRSGASTNTSVLAVMPYGAGVTLTGQRQNGFVSATYNGQSGWAYESYLTIGGTPAPSPSPSPSPTTPSPGSGLAVTTTSLNLRSGPSTNNSILAVMPAGAQVQLTGVAQGGFYQVVYNGTTGWASTQYLTLGGNPAPTNPGNGNSGGLRGDTDGNGSLSQQEIIQIIYDAADRYGQPREDMLRVARCESVLDPNAVNPAGSYGLFQFVPSTWATTPYADEDIFDAYASANAAGWMWSVGRRNEWVCQ